MATSKSDKPLVRNLIIGVAAAIAIFVGAFFPELKYFGAVGTILTIVGVLATSYFSYKAYVNADDPNKDYFRWLIVAATVLTLVTVGITASTIRSEKSENIPGEYGNPVIK